MIYFELDSEGNLSPQSYTRDNFASIIDLKDVDLDPDKLLRYDIDCPDSIIRKVILSDNEILNQNRALIKLFLRSKKLQGCSNDTIKTYNGHLVQFFYSVIKPVGEIRCIDIKNYIMDYAENRDIRYNTLCMHKHARTCNSGLSKHIRCKSSRTLLTRQK